MHFEMQPLQFHPDYGDPAVCCPRCGHPFLHQGRVVVRMPDDEDADTRSGIVGTCVQVVDGRSASVQRVDGQQLLGRRISVTIDFSCEECAFDGDMEGGDPGPVSSTLVIQQHKGNTFIYWARKVQR